MNRRHGIAGVVAGLALLAPRAFADNENAVRIGNDEAMTVWSIYQSNQNERDMATLAKDKASSQPVKDLSGRLLEDSRTADAKIRAYANKRHIDLDALSHQVTRTIDDQLEGDRMAHSVGSSMGEYAFTAENAVKTSREAGTAIGKLRRLDGTEFDRAFTRSVVRDHQSLVDVLANARKQANDDDMKDLIDGLMPDVEQHLAAAQKLAVNL